MILYNLVYIIMYNILLIGHKTLFLCKLDLFNISTFCDFILYFPYNYN